MRYGDVFVLSLELLGSQPHLLQQRLKRHGLPGGKLYVALGYGLEPASGYRGCCGFVMTHAWTLAHPGCRTKHDLPRRVPWTRRRPGPTQDGKVGLAPSLIQRTYIADDPLHATTGLCARPGRAGTPL